MKRASSMITPGGAYKKYTRPAKRTRKPAKKLGARFSTLDKAKGFGQRVSGLFSYSGEGPFPQKLATTLLYRSVAGQYTGSASTGSKLIQVGLNDLFDFDSSGDLGNKQPLFYDDLMTATGPYNRLECKSWRTTIVLINTGAESLSIYWNGRGTAISATEEDSLTEYTNKPYVQQFHLGPKGSSMDRVTIRSNGKWVDHNTDNTGSAQAYNSSPSTIVYGSLFTQSPSSLTAPTFTAQIDHFFDIVCERIDATIS